MPYLPRYHDTTYRFPRCPKLDKVHLDRNSVDKPGFPTAICGSCCVVRESSPIDDVVPDSVSILLWNFLNLRFYDIHLELDAFSFQSLCYDRVGDSGASGHAIGWGRTLIEYCLSLSFQSVVIPYQPNGLVIDFPWKNILPRLALIVSRHYLLRLAQFEL